MRPLKFRAWDTKEKKWLWPYPEGFHIIGEVTVFNVLEQIAFNRVNDLEIVQWTGLKDKNGKELYEGDIIREEYLDHFNDDGENEIYLSEIIFSSGAFVRKEDVQECCLVDIHSDDFEIIGNKFENPELLK